MKSLDAQVKKLHKLQKKGKKQAAYLNKVARQQWHDMALPDQVNHFAQKSVEEVKGFGLFDRLRLNLAKIKKVSIFVLLSIGMVVLVSFLLRKYKQQQDGNSTDCRFDFFDEFGDGMENNFDLDNASLEELEEALLKAENELSELSDEISNR